MFDLGDLIMINQVNLNLEIRVSAFLKCHQFDFRAIFLLVRVLRLQDRMLNLMHGEPAVVNAEARLVQT